MKVRYIWKAEKSFVSVLFLINRYITLIVLAIDMYDKGGTASRISDRFCFSWYFVEGTWYVTSFGIIHTLVAMRVAALWGRTRWVVVLLGSLWVAYFSATSSIVFSALVSRADTIKFEPTLRLCYLSIILSSWACWIPPLTLETVLFTLSCIQAFRTGRYNTKTPLFRVLVRDGVFHFLVIVCCSLFNMITWMVAPPTLVKGTLGFGLAIANAMISRMIINLRSCRDTSSIPAPPSGQHYVEEVELSVHSGGKVHIKV
ncbi:dephospho-CoA kinase [Ceratobasidium sp. AG-Ba]|nr:dephospho-CoA kinase [Ceratobasidium sp. AG-Ba]